MKLYLLHALFICIVKFFDVIGRTISTSCVGIIVCMVTWNISYYGKAIILTCLFHITVVGVFLKLYDTVAQQYPKSFRSADEVEICTFHIIHSIQKLRECIKGKW